MILVDTSVWISHLRVGEPLLKSHLLDGNVVCHPFIVGELACGKIKNRKEFFTLIHALPVIDKLTHDEVIKFIELHQLMDAGIGYVDVHLLGSALLSEIPLWTFDRKLMKAAKKLKVHFQN